MPILYHFPHVPARGFQPAPARGSPGGDDRRPTSPPGARADRLPDRGRRHAPAARDRLDAQPRAHDRRLVPGQGSADRLALGRALLHAAAGRRRPGGQQRRLAVGGRHRHRRRALLPHLQPDCSRRGSSTRTAPTSGAGCRSWRGVPAPMVHEPWRQTPLEQKGAGLAIGRDYPMPVVDHGMARARTLAAYARARGPR